MDFFRKEGIKKSPSIILGLKAMKQARLENEVRSNDIANCR